MKILQEMANSNGSRPPIQTWPTETLPDGFVAVPSDFDAAVFQEYNGFVNITAKDGIVTSMTPNVAAWEVWKASLPEQTAAMPQKLENYLLDLDYRISLAELGIFGIS